MAEQLFSTELIGQMRRDLEEVDRLAALAERQLSVMKQAGIATGEQITQLEELKKKAARMRAAFRSHGL